MSSTEHHETDQHEIVPQKFTVQELVELLRDAKTLAHPPGLEKTLDVATAGTTATASEAEWTKFFAAVNSIADVPVTTYLLDEGEGDDAARGPTLTLVASVAVQVMVQIATRLWQIFRGIDDKAGRELWTQQLVRDAWAGNPNFNYVVVCTSHSINFDGRENEDWSRRTYRYELRIGGINYTLYALRGGVFSLHGDGGFLNWAFIGRVVSRDPDNRRPRNIVFRA